MLAAKAVLDCVIILIMTSALGIGCVFSAIPVGIFQGLVTLFAFLIGPLLSQALIDAIGLTGSMMIFAVGVNLVWGRNSRSRTCSPPSSSPPSGPSSSRIGKESIF